MDKQQCMITIPLDDYNKLLKENQYLVGIIKKEL